MWEDAFQWITSINDKDKSMFLLKSHVLEGNNRMSHYLNYLTS
jgi:hypothetical protein